MEQFNSLLQVANAFPTEEKAHIYLQNIIWKGGEPTCPHCQHKDKIYRYKNRKLFKCGACKKQFTVTVNTIFHRSHIPLNKWIIALYLMSQHKKGISSIQLGKDLGVTQKTAYFMLGRIRKAITNESFTAPLSGVVEVDETYCGGKYKNRHYNKRIPGQQGRGGTEKTPLFGILERGGRVKTMKVPDVKGDTLKTIIYENVTPDTTIMSDEWHAYNGLNKTYRHLRVDHGRYQYVNGEIYTNTLEGYWATVKRSITGCYHHVSRKHIDEYCAEWDMRYNTRNEPPQNTINLILSQAGCRLTYKQFTK